LSSRKCSKMTGCQWYKVGRVSAGEKEL